jgi:hypothetical protein
MMLHGRRLHDVACDRMLGCGMAVLLLEFAVIGTTAAAELCFALLGQADAVHRRS